MDIKQGFGSTHCGLVTPYGVSQNFVIIGSSHGLLPIQY